MLNAAVALFAISTKMEWVTRGFDPEAYFRLDDKPEQSICRAKGMCGHVPLHPGSHKTR
jgi:hypothetical protein